MGVAEGELAGICSTFPALLSTTTMTLKSGDRLAHVPKSGLLLAVDTDRAGMRVCEGRVTAEFILQIINKFFASTYIILVVLGITASDEKRVCLQSEKRG